MFPPIDLRPMALSSTEVSRRAFFGLRRRKKGKMFGTPIYAAPRLVPGNGRSPWRTARRVRAGTDGHCIRLRTLVRDNDCTNARSLRTFDVRISRHRIDNEAIPVDDALALAEHHIADERNRLCRQIINTEIAGSILVPADDQNIPVRLDATYILRVWHRAGGRIGFDHRSVAGDTYFLAVEHHERPTSHRGIALHYLYVSAERCGLFLILNFQRLRVDLNREVLLLALSTRE